MFRRLRNAGTQFLSLTLAVMSANAHANTINDPASTQPAPAAIDSSTGSEPVRPIGAIDFYGLHRLTAEPLRNKLTFKVGDLVTLRDYSFFAPSEQRLMMVPGVLHARVQVVCCADGRSVVFIGIDETNAPTMKFRPAPTGLLRLPPDALQVDTDFMQLWAKEVLSGHAEEDDSEGRMLLLDSAARPIEDEMIAVANSDLGLLRKVLRDSADPENRASAAQLLGYAKDQQLVVPDLVYAMSDSAENVRNNAIRALMVFTRATKVKPPRVPYEPFIALLNSPVWTDRNKSSGALMEMAGSRDPTLLTMLRKRALASLVEMARWSDRGYAYPAFRILGYVAGLDDKDVDESEQNDRERVIKRALSMNSSKPSTG
jgi:hypothetical protein